MKTLTKEEFEKKYGKNGLEVANATAKKDSFNMFAIPSKENLMQSAKDVIVGAGKGLMQSGTGLIQGITSLGTAAQAALSPTETYGSLKKQQEEIGSPFIGEKATQINEQLKAKNTGEKVGKSLEFIAELLTPTGVRTAVGKGTNTATDLFKGVGSKLSSVPDDLVEGGVKVKDKIGDLLVNLDAKTKTALERTPREVFDEVVQTGKKAMEDDRAITPIESVGNKIIDSIKNLSNKAKEIGEKKSSYFRIPEPFKGNGIKSTNEALQSFLNSRTLTTNDQPIVKKIVSEFKRLGKNPTRGQVDKFIDYAQDMLYAGEKNLVQPISNKTTSRLKAIIGSLNNSLKSQMPDEFSKLNDEFSELRSLTNEINVKLGKKGQSAGSFVKRLFSPSDARTKQLFEEIEKRTGEDFTRDARLAKFVMDALGDTRVASLLEQIPTSKGDVLSKAIKYGVSKISDPIKTAERYITK